MFKELKREAYDANVAVPISWFVASNGCIIGKHPGIGSLDWFDQQVKALDRHQATRTGLREMWKSEA